MSNTFNDGAIKHAPWSHSKLNVLNQCTLRFDLKYIQNKKEPPITDSRGRIGNAAHKTLELIMTKGLEMNRAMKQAAFDNKLTTNETDDLLGFRVNINNFLERYQKYKEKFPVGREAIEHRFGITVTMQPTTFFGKDVFFRGATDVSLFLQNKDVVVIDHKSSDKREEQSGNYKYEEQLKVYAVASLVEDPALRGVQSAIHYIKTEEIEWSTYVKSNTIQDEYIPWLVKYVNDASVRLIEPVKATKGWYCTFCGYKPACPAWRP